jgi:hypothetical protein
MNKFVYALIGILVLLIGSVSVQGFDPEGVPVLDISTIGPLSVNPQEIPNLDYHDPRYDTPGIDGGYEGDNGTSSGATPEANLFGKLPSNWWITYNEPDVGVTVRYMVLHADLTAALYQTASMTNQVARINFDISGSNVGGTWYETPDDTNIASIISVHPVTENLWHGDNMIWDDHPGIVSDVTMERIV